MRRVGFSIYIPFLAILHMGTGRGLVFSRCCSFGWLAHYGHKRRSLGRSEKNIMGIWGHYDPRGRCTGYSRRRGLLIRHFNDREEPMGATISLGILLLHFLKK